MIDLQRACDMPKTWSGARQWRTLEIHDAPSPCASLNFLRTWAAWRRDPQRCRVLHYVLLVPHGARVVNAQAAPVRAFDNNMTPLADALAQQAWGLVAGIHRLNFEDGHVLLTVCIGNTHLFLREQAWRMDTVRRVRKGASVAPDEAAQLKAIARCCALGARLVSDSLGESELGLYRQCGFTAPVPVKAGNTPEVWESRYAPHWPLKTAAEAKASAQKPSAPVLPGRCIVVGAGLAGASAAASLARRGWHVVVLDSSATPASGASGLPVGLFGPNLAADDNAVSRISRAGVRATVHACTQLLQAGQDWSRSGVLERRPPGKSALPTAWSASAQADTQDAEQQIADARDDWSQPATAHQLADAHFPTGDTACWHWQAGWVKPARLVAALMAQPGIDFRPIKVVATLSHRTSVQGQPLWQAHAEDGTVWAEAEMVVVAAGPASAALLSTAGLPLLPLQAIRGQMSWGLQSAGTPLPPFPVNGRGALTAHIPVDGGIAWHAGSTFERGKSQLPVTLDDQQRAHAVNLQHLGKLLPAAAHALSAAFDPANPSLRSWAGVRCTVPDRLPLVGPVAAVTLTGLWLCTGMGARGLSRAVLCGEILAALVHQEPLPLETKLANAMAADRFNTC